MRHNALSVIIVVIFALLLAACTDDPPSDVSGCKPNPDDAADTNLYDNERGCLYRVQEPIEHGEGEHEEEAGEEEHTEGESTEEHSEEGESTEEHAEESPTQEATEEAHN